MQAMMTQRLEVEGSALTKWGAMRAARRAAREVRAASDGKKDTSVGVAGKSRLFGRHKWYVTSAR